MPFAIPAIISALLSIVFSVASAMIGSALQGKKKPRKVDSPDQRQRQNLTDTTAYVPVVYGIARCGGLRVLGFTKNAFVGTAYTQSGGTSVEVDTRGDYFYQLTVFCEGEVDDVQTIYVDGVDSSDPKFNSPYRVDLSLTWTYSEPSPVQVYTAPLFNANGFRYSPTTSWGAPNPEYAKYQGKWTKPIRYNLFRKAAAGGQEINIMNFEGFGLTVPKTIKLTNTDYGNWIFTLKYKKDTGETIEVGTGTVEITQDNVDFVQSVNDNLTITQNSRQDGAYIKSEERRGTEGQSTLSWFLAEGVEGYDSNSIGNKLCLVGHRFLKHTKGPSAENSVINKVPEVTAVIKGKKVYDPRTRLTQWSDNPTLCILDYLTNKIYGVGIALAYIDLDSFNDAADYCEEIVTNPDGSTMNRYTINGVVDTSQRLVDNLQDLLDTCNGHLYNDSGKFGIKILKPESISGLYHFSLDNIVGNIDIDKTRFKDKINQIKVRWTNPEKKWTTDIITITDAAYLAQDKDEVLETELQLDNITDYNHAYRLGVIYLKQSRLGLSVKFQSFYESYQCRVGDLVTFTHQAFGWTNKVFRVQRMNVTTEGLIEFELAEYDPLVYDVEDFELQPAYTNSNLSSPFEVQAPSNIQTRQSFEFDSLGNFQAIVYFDWLSSSSSAIVAYQVEYKPFAFGEWAIAGRIQTNSISLLNLQVGKYSVRVKAINNIGAESSYTTRDIEVVAITDIPPDVSNFVIKNANNEVTLTWDLVPQVANGGWYRIKHTQKTSNPQWSDHQTFETLLPGSQTSITLSQIDGTYMIKAVNIAGIESSNEAKLIYDLPDDSAWQTVSTIQADPLFTGTRDYTVAIDGNLSLDGLTLFDSESGMFDDKIGMFDDGGGFSNVGSYTHNELVDLGAVYKVKLKKDVVATITQVGQNFDDADGLFDDRAGFFDGSTPINATANILFRMTNDNPSGSPTWSDWQLLTMNQVTGRGFQFRAELFTSSPEEKIYVEQLRCNVQLPFRVETGSASITGAAQQVNFNKAFYSAPTVTVVITNPASGDYVQTSNITATGFKVTCKDSSNATVSRNINFIAQSLGEVQV